MADVSTSSAEPLAGKAAIVTGASRGIGRATAQMLGAEGARVLLVGRDGSALADAARDAGGTALAVNVALPDAAERIVATCLERFGRVDALVNNAGWMRRQPLSQLTDPDGTSSGS